jgi:hypothetical protein
VEKKAEAASGIAETALHGLDVQRLGPPFLPFFFSLLFSVRDPFSWLGHRQTLRAG